MKTINELLTGKSDCLSFEVYPPKKNVKTEMDIINRTIGKLTHLNPDFISVTFGAGGSNKGKAVEISEMVQNNGTTPLAHLTSVGYTKNDIGIILDNMYSKGIKNILALRGDIPQEVEFPNGAWTDFEFAKNLISYIKSDGRFCIGAAAYPEGHKDCKDVEISVNHLREKVEAGADFFITQLFFENDNYYKFIDMVEKLGMNMPIIPAILPVLKANQVNRIVELSGASIPPELASLLEKYKDDDVSMKAAGKEFAAKQIENLRSQGIKYIHLYTMNKYKSVAEIVKMCGLR